MKAILENRLVHGCDYNPEQWLDRPDVLQRDVALMGEAGINLVSLGVFSWSVLEPRDGEFDFAWLDHCVERLHRGGIRICLATATAALPPWLVRAHPEVARQGADQTRQVAGPRHNFCWSSPVLRRKSTVLISRISERYGSHPALFAWHLNNELGGNADCNRCYCDGCVSRFQEWLRGRFDADLDRLNGEWWTSFWSNRYSSWEEIRPGDTGVEGLATAWFRFCSEQVADFLRHEIAAVRKFSDARVTTNLHSGGACVDDALLAKEVDFVSYDSYPAITGDPASDRAELIAAAFHADRMRGLLDKPWLLLESCPTQPQHLPFARAKRPGIHRLLSLQQVAHGSDGVCTFQWRAGRGGSEKMHGAICAWDAPERTRVFGEVAELGNELDRLGGVAGGTISAEVAIVWDAQAQWHFESNAGLDSVDDPRTRCLRVYTALWEASMPTDVVSFSADLSRYRLILLPGVFMLTEAVIAGLVAAVGRGATVLSDPLTGWVNEHQCVLPGGRLGPELRELFGLSCEEFDCLRADEAVAIESVDTLLPSTSRARQFCDIVRPESGEVLARFAGEFYAGSPALVSRRSGTGRALYLSADLESSALKHLLLGLCSTLSISPPICNIPDGLQVRSRINGQREFLFVSNVSDDLLKLSLDFDGHDALTGDSVADGETVFFSPADVRIFERQLQQPHST